MRHWIFIANDNHWDWIKNQKVGEVEEWTALSELGRLKRYFSAVQVGDKVIGYSSGRTRAFVALGIIESPLITQNERRFIEIRKTEEFIKPLAIEIVRQFPPFDTILQTARLNTTAIPIELDDYNKLLSLISDSFIDSYDNVEIELNSQDIDIADALKLKPQKNSANITSWIRDSRISKAAIKRANYKCELSTDTDSHESFIASFTNRNFVEAHHLIPMKEQSKFTFSLDNALNIVALCPNCHRLVHYGEKVIRYKKISELYKRRKKDIETFKVLESELIKMYE
jgi:hypothetical protein